MKKSYILYFFLFFFKLVSSQTLNYTFTTLGGTYVALTTPTTIPEIYFGADDEISGTYNIGFSFQFACVAYTQFKVSSNGWLTFNTAAASSDPTNDLPNNTTMRPGIAPLWDDLAFNNNAVPPQCSYAVLGTSPNRVLAVQWTRAYWKILGGSPGAMSFQTRLYESSNRIEMIYSVETGSLNAPSASIGLAGITTGDYYSVNTALSAATKTNNITNIALKPSQGLILRWDPPCTTLPIHLLSFTGENKAGKNILKWTTGSEKNNDYFNLERSDDGTSFYSIKKISGCGMLSCSTDYQTTDEAIHKGIIYYRLKQTDFDKSYTYSHIISIGKEIEKDALNISPNPADTKVFVEDKEGRAFSLINYSGQIIKEGLIENSEINVSEIKDGFYFLKVNGIFEKLLIRH